MPQGTRSSPAGRWRVSRWSRIWPVAASRRVRCPVIRIGRAQPPSEPICRARGARCPAAASLAVSRARRSSEKPCLRTLRPSRRAQVWRTLRLWERRWLRGTGVGAVWAWGQTSGRSREKGRGDWWATRVVDARGNGGRGWWAGASGLVSGGVHRRCVKVASLQRRIQVHPSSSVSCPGGVRVLCPAFPVLDGPDFGDSGAERAGDQR